MPRQCPSIDALHSRDVALAQIFIERHLRAPVARDLAQLFDDKAAHMWFAAFAVEGIDAVIADQRISHRYDLSAIRRIGQHLLVTGHRGVEANLADACTGCAKRFTLEMSAVFE